MKKIPSFTIDHVKLLRGIYVSRRDMVGGEEVTTFDIRMKEPNREPVMHPCGNLPAQPAAMDGPHCLLGTHGLSHRQLSADAWTS